MAKKPSIRVSDPAPSTPRAAPAGVPNAESIAETDTCTCGRDDLAGYCPVHTRQPDGTRTPDAES